MPLLRELSIFILSLLARCYFQCRGFHALEGGGKTTTDKHWQYFAYSLNCYLAVGFAPEVTSDRIDDLPQDFVDPENLSNLIAFTASWNALWTAYHFGDDYADEYLPDGKRSLWGAHRFSCFWSCGLWKFTVFRDFDATSCSKGSSASTQRKENTTC